MCVETIVALSRLDRSLALKALTQGERPFRSTNACRRVVAQY